MDKKELGLEKILAGLGSALIAFSGGVDSSYLLYKARKCLGENLLAVTAAWEVHTAGELARARRVAREIGAGHLVIRGRMLESSEFAANPPCRCYYCKRELPLIENCRGFAMEQMPGIKQTSAPGSGRRGSCGCAAPCVKPA